MLRGCLFSLLLMAAVAGGYFYWFDQVFDPPGTWIGAGVVGFLVLCCVGAINNARTAWGDWSRVSAARFGGPLTDGRVVAVSGTIHPVGEPLVAPFSHVPCVLCEYDLAGQKRLSDRSDNTNSGSDYAGFLMVPSVIRTPLGDVRLLGFPILKGFAEVRSSGYAAARNAREFLTSNQFEDRTGVNFVKVLSVFGEIWSDDDGRVEKNMRMGKVSLEELFPPELDEELQRLAQWEREHPDAVNDDRVDEDELEDDEQLADDENAADNDLAHDDAVDQQGRPKLTQAIPKLVETRVPVGENVSVIGIYDELRRGLLPPPGSTKPNRLLRGTADQIERELRSSIGRQLLGGIIGLVVIHAAIVGVMAIYQHSPDVIRDRQQAATQAVAKVDLDALARLVRRGLDVNFRDSNGWTLLMLANDAAASGWLIEHGADVNAADNAGQTALGFAARSGRADIVRQLIVAHADLNPRSRTTERKPLAEAIMNGHDEVVALLRQAGAQD